MVRASWLLMVIAVATSCVTSNATDCGDGTTCPAGSQCDVDQGRCLRPEQLVACEGKDEQEECEIDGRLGVCRIGACELYFCGDGLVRNNEACDGVNLDGQTCSDRGFYADAGLACDTSCKFDESACGGGFCGDDIVNGSELCDGQTNKTCLSIGFDGGSVSCDESCGLTIRDCSRFGWNPEALNSVVALAVGGASALDHWAVGLSGRATRWEGAFWNAVPTHVTNNLIAVWGIAPDDVWVVGEGTSSANPAVLLWFNGTQWSTVTGTPAANFVDIWAAGPDAVYAATSGSGIQTWNGVSWSELGALNREAIAIRGSGPNDIWVATQNGPLMHWNGSAWAPSTLTNAQVRFIDANAADDVWVIGNDAASPGIGLIGHFDGTTWTTWRTPQETYNNIASTAPNDTWVAGADGTMRHWDGVGWLSTNNIGASPSGLAAVSGLMAFNANEVIAVSTLNLAYRYRGQSFGRFPNLPFPDPFAASVHRGMWGTGADNVWVTTVKGEIFHFNGTAPWTLSTVVDPGLTIAANGVWGTSASDVWVAAQDGRVLQRSGTTWTSHAVSPGLAIQEIWSTSPTDVWAFGTGGAFHYNGTTWTRFVLSNTLVHGAHGSGPDDLYVVTAPDTAGHALWHWDGTAWSAVTTLVASTKLNNVFAIAPNLVFVVANNGHIHGWNGTAWRDDLLEATAELKFLSGSAIDDVVAASERELFHWDGRQWSAMRPPIDFVPNTLDYLPMVDLLVSPGRIDMLLQRFRVRTLLRTRPLHCRPDEDSCTDAVDNDCDGKVDSADDQCP